MIIILFYKNLYSRAVLLTVGLLIARCQGVKGVIARCVAHVTINAGYAKKIYCERMHT